MAWLPRLVTAFDGGAPALHETQPGGRSRSSPGTGLADLRAYGDDPAPVILHPLRSGHSQAAPVLDGPGPCACRPCTATSMLNQVLVAAKRQPSGPGSWSAPTIVNPVCNLVFIRVAQRPLAQRSHRRRREPLGHRATHRRHGDRSDRAPRPRNSLALASGPGDAGRTGHGRGHVRTAAVGFVAAAVAGGVFFMGAVVALRVPSAEEWAWARHGTLHVGRRLARWNPVRRGSP